MDITTLSNLFAATLDPNPNGRMAAELEVRKVGKQEGAIAAILEIIINESIDISTRQACTIFLKNRVHHGYFYGATRGSEPQVAESDKAALRASLLPLLVAAPSRSISTQLAQTLKLVVSEDFPKNWPGLLPDINKMLTSGGVREAHAGCIALLEVVRAFRFRQSEDMMPGIVSETFPTLVNIALQLIASPPPAPLTPTSPEIPAMLHLILKTYKSSVLVHLSKHQQSSESLVPWGRLLFQVIQMQIPAGMLPEDTEEREKCEWWKAKKWAFATLNRLFHRFGNPSQLPSTMKKDYADFAQHFVDAFAPEIFRVYLQQVELLISGNGWVSNKCQYLIFHFLTECVKPKSTWALLKPHYETLVRSYVFPQMSFTPARVELWATDPAEFVRASLDEYEDYSTAVSSATTFLYALASNRTKSTFMGILELINSVLNSETSSPEQRYGALNMTVALGPFIMKHPIVKPNMESFVMQHVYPALSSPHGYLRCVAQAVIAIVEKSGIEWSNTDNLSAVAQAVVNGLDDPELPVQVHAALALTEQVIKHASVKTAVGGMVGKVVQDLLRLSEETDLDLLNHSLEVMVEHFTEELLPVAAALTSRLCETYLRIVRENVSQEDKDAVQPIYDISITQSDDDDKTFAAMGIAKTIDTVLGAVDSSSDILVEVERIITPIISFTLEKKQMDLYDNMYELADSLTFRTKAVTPEMWRVFELTYNLFKTDAIDFLDEMLPALDNFLSYGTYAFREREDYRNMIIDMYNTTMNSDSLGEQDRVNGCKLAESLLLNLRGYVDEAVAPIIRTSLDLMPSAETKNLKIYNLILLISAIFYNPRAALTIMGDRAPAFFNTWFAAIDDTNGLPRVHDKRISILALCALLELDPASVPESLHAGWPAIVSSILKLFKQLPAAVEARKAAQDAAVADQEDDDEIEEEILDLEENDDRDVWDEDSEYIELLAKEGARLREKANKVVNSDDEESLTDSDESVEEELGFISPVDHIDPYSTFKRTLTALQHQNAAAYQASTASLNTELQTQLMEVMHLAERREANGQDGNNL